MHVLVVSPIPSHPLDQGNSARIHSLCSALQSLGHVVHFFYYAMEGLTGPQRAQMEAAWEYVHTMPARMDTNTRSLGECFGVDDWYDEAAGEAVRRLHDRYGFGIVLVNYVWFSGVLDALPDSVLKVIDTHDVFGNRHQRFLDKGRNPEWFYTTPEEERRGLARAHVVLAIQDEEEQYLRTLMSGTTSEVHTVGYLAPARGVPRRRAGAKPVLGYIGSGNPFNVVSVTDFARKALAMPSMAQRYEYLLAGSICRAVDGLPPFEPIGPVNSLAEFYSRVDCALNPMGGGTGLKIKTLEALSFGKLVAGTPDAFVGVQVRRARAEPLAARIEQELRALGEDWIVLSQADARLTYTEYHRRQVAAFTELFTTTATGSRDQSW